MSVWCSWIAFFSFLNIYYNFPNTFKTFFLLDVEIDFPTANSPFSTVLNFNKRQEFYQQPHPFCKTPSCHKKALYWNSTVKWKWNKIWRLVFYNFIYLFLFFAVLRFCCCMGFSLIAASGGCDRQTSHCSGFSYCITQALGQGGFSTCSPWAQ